jgi:hypothetical protein
MGGFALVTPSLRFCSHECIDAEQSEVEADIPPATSSCTVVSNLGYLVRPGFFPF